MNARFDKLFTELDKQSAGFRRPYLEFLESLFCSKPAATVGIQVPRLTVVVLPDRVDDAAFRTELRRRSGRLAAAGWLLIDQRDVKKLVPALPPSPMRSGHSLRMLAPRSRLPSQGCSSRAHISAAIHSRSIEDLQCRRVGGYCARSLRSSVPTLPKRSSLPTALALKPGLPTANLSGAAHLLPPREPLQSGDSGEITTGRVGPRRS